MKLSFFQIIRVTILSISSTVLFMACQAPIIGAGTPVTIAKNLTEFNAVLTDVVGDIKVIAKPGLTYALIIEAQPNIMPLITTEIVKGELLISFKQGAHVKSYAPIKATINTSNLQSVKLLGSTSISVSDSILTPHDMMCSIMGSGHLDLNNGIYNNLRLQNSGSGILTANNCTALMADLGLKGAGEIAAKTSLLKSARAIVHGNGTIRASVTDSLVAETKDAGTIEYVGKPAYTKLKTGKVGIVKNVQ